MAAKLTRRLGFREATEDNIVELVNRELLPLVRMMHQHYNDAFGSTVAVDASTILGVTYQFYLADASDGPITLTLPEAGAEMAVHIKKVDSSGNAVTVAAQGTAEIDGALSYALAAQYDSAIFVSDGTNWWMF